MPTSQGSRLHRQQNVREGGGGGGNAKLSIAAIFETIYFFAIVKGESTSKRHQNH